MRGTACHTTGMLTEYLAAAYYTQQGYTVCWPMVTQSAYDFIAEKDGVFKRVQVKTPTWSKAGYYLFLQCRLGSDQRSTDGISKGSKYTVSCDELFFTRDGRTWIFPSDVLSETSNVCLASTNPKPRKNGKSYDPNQYEVTNG